MENAPGQGSGQPGDTFPFSCPQLTQHRLTELLPAHKAFPVPSRSGHRASPPCHGSAKQRVAPAGAAGVVTPRSGPICRCLSLPAPYNILPSTNRGSCNVRARAGGRRAGVAPAQPALIGSGPCPTPGLWQAQGTFKPCPLLTAGPMTLLARCCFERTFARFPVIFYLGNVIPSPSGLSIELLLQWQRGATGCSSTARAARPGGDGGFNSAREGLTPPGVHRYREQQELELWQLPCSRSSG